ncbi:hypothetical protein EPN42_10155 [bacterium]|nr:MAG: hypothetical protein EPN42_10155 [bacterium]
MARRVCGSLLDAAVLSGALGCPYQPPHWTTDATAGLQYTDQPQHLAGTAPLDEPSRCPDICAKCDDRSNGIGSLEPLLHLPLLLL